MSRSESHRRPSVAPRLLSAEQAASYLGYATTALLANIPVRPVQMAEKGPGSLPKYDRRALDAWLDKLSGLSVANAGPEEEDVAEAAYEAWKARRAG